MLHQCTMHRSMAHVARRACRSSSNMLQTIKSPSQLSDALASFNLLSGPSGRLRLIQPRACASMRPTSHCMQHSAFPTASQRHFGTTINKNLKVLTNYVGGAQTKTRNSDTHQLLPMINPSTGEHYAQLQLSTPQDFDTVVQVAQQAYPAWSALTYKARSQYLLRLRQVLLQHEDELAQLITFEHGKNHVEALGSLHKGIEVLEYACSLSNNRDAIGMQMEVSTGVTCSEYRQSLGVCAAITPFNFPIMCAMWSISIALATGNTIVVKPSEKSPQTLLRVAQLAVEEAQLPKGVLNVVLGAAPIVEAMCKHPQVAAVTFVGSSKVAQRVEQLCHASQSGKRVVAMGGAKNHLIALADAARDQTATDIVVSFTGCAGQRCMAASVLILVGQQPELVDLIVQKARALQFGHAAGEVGPVIDQAAMQRITSYLDFASSDPQTKVLLDGRQLSHTKDADKYRSGFWVGPCVLLHSNASNRCIREEIFGPVLSIYVAATVDEAIAIENASPYGNAACVYTSVGAHAQYVERRLQAGMIGINIGVPVPREPLSFGGNKSSRYGAHESTGAGAVNFFTRIRKVTSKWVPPQSEALALGLTHNKAGKTNQASDWMS